MTGPRHSETLRCTFCGADRRHVRHLIASQIEKVFICDECVRLMADMLEADMTLDVQGETRGRHSGRK